VDNRAEIREFLTTRRAKDHPGAGGAPAGLGHAPRARPAARRGRRVRPRPRGQALPAGPAPDPADSAAERDPRPGVDVGRALYSPVFDGPARPANLARFCFLDPTSREFYPDWDDVAQVTVALLRTEAGRDPYNRELTDLIGEFATRSEKFRALWAAHDVRLHQTGTKHFRHPVVGLVEVAFVACLPARYRQRAFQ